MFRDLKAYQDFAKIYAEKVSKPENLEEKIRGGGVSSNPAKIQGTPPQGGTGGGVGNKTNVRGIGARNNRTKPEIKKFPSTAEIRSKSTTGMSNIPSKEGNAVIDGKKLNPDFGKKVDIKKEFPDKTKTGTETKTNTNTTNTTETKPLSTREKFNKKFIRDPKTKTLKRRGSPTARRAENLEKNRLKAQAMAKARIEAKKKAGEQGNSTQSNSTQSNSTQSNSSSQTMTASYTPDMDAYDMVLEYLLSTEQAATTEEANYVMMQLDEENIQEIVKLITKTPLVKLIPAAIGTGIATKMIASKMGEKSVQPVAPPEVKKPSNDIQVGDGIEQRKKGESLMDYYKRRKNSLETQDKKLGAGEY